MAYTAHSERTTIAQEITDNTLVHSVTRCYGDNDAELMRGFTGMRYTDVADLLSDLGYKRNESRDWVTRRGAQVVMWRRTQAGVQSLMEVVCRLPV